MNKGRLHHIEIYVNDLDKTKEFWSWFLTKMGYTKFQTWKKGFSFKLDQTYIVFVQVKEKYTKIEFNRCQGGLNHLAFYGDNRKQIDDLTKELEQNNCKILYKDKHPFAGGKNHYAVYFEDPNRLKLEVIANE